MWKLLIVQKKNKITISSLENYQLFSPIFIGRMIKQGVGKFFSVEKECPQVFARVICTVPGFVLLKFLHFNFEYFVSKFKFLYHNFNWVVCNYILLFDFYILHFALCIFVILHFASLCYNFNSAVLLQPRLCSESQF